MVEDVAEEPPRTRIDWAATIAGAGAAVTVAVLLSTLGAAGTLIGAALGSVIATVSTALYKQGIETSKRRMLEVQTAALEKVNLADQSVRRASSRSDGEATERELARAHRHLDAASSDLEDNAADEPGPAVDEPSRWASLPWRRIAVLAAVVFVLALLVLSLVELLAGKSVSTITGGTDGDDRTSISGVFEDDGDEAPPRREAPTDEPTAPTTGTAPTPTETPTGVPSGSPPESVTPTPTVTVTVTEEPSPSPSDTPTGPATPLP